MKKRPCSIFTIMLLVSVLIFHQRGFCWEIKKDTLVVSVKEIINPELPRMSKKDLNVAFREAEKLLMKKLGVKVKFQTVKEEKMESAIPSSAILGVGNYTNGQGFKSLNPLEAFDEQDFQKALTQRITNLVTLKAYFDTTLDELKKASSLSADEQNKIHTPEELSAAITKRFDSYLKKLMAAEINGKPVVQKGKEKFLWLQVWINAFAGNPIHRNNTYDVTLTNEPILDLSPDRLSSETLSYTCCLPRFSWMLTSSFVHYYGYETGTSLEKITQEMKPRDVGIDIAYEVIEELLRLYSPAMMDKEHAKKGFKHLIDLQNEWLKQRTK